MGTRIGTWMRNLGAKRILALAIGPGLLAIGLDAAIAHFAGRPMRAAGQLVPVGFAPAACLALVAAAVATLGAEAFRRVLRAVAFVAIVVGLAGTAFHAKALTVLLAGEALTAANLTAALAVAPPLFAPGSFAGIGVLVWLVASPRLTLRYEVAAAARVALAGEVVELPTRTEVAEPKRAA